MKVRLLVTGRSYETAEQIPGQLTLPEGSSVDEALQAMAGFCAAGKGLPESCLVAVSGTHLGTLRRHQPYTLSDGDELVLIAPVAGG
jgi:molybdopterin converting factor small subunit